MKNIIITLALALSALTTQAQNKYGAFPPNEVTAVTVGGEIIGYAYMGTFNPTIDGPVSLNKIRTIAAAYNLNLPAEYQKPQIVETRGRALKLAGKYKNTAILLQAVGTVAATEAMSSGDIEKMQQGVIISGITSLGSLILNIMGNIQLDKAGELMPEQIIIE